MSEPIAFPDQLLPEVSRPADCRPGVVLRVSRRSLLLPPDQAFALGMQLIQAAQSQLAESFLADWCRSSNWDPEQVQLLLGQYREWLQSHSSPRSTV